jgi:hypothetical protein
MMSSSSSAGLTPHLKLHAHEHDHENRHPWFSWLESWFSTA